MSITNSGEFYGLISGKTSSTMAKATNERLENAQIVSVWNNITEFQKDVGSNAREEIRGIQAILITDYAFDTTSDMNAKVFAFDFMQSMFKQKELYGKHLILFTKDKELHERLEQKYTEEEDSKYEGTKILYNPDKYTVSSLLSVFSSPFKLLNYGEKKQRDMAKMEEEARDSERRLIARRGYLLLLGKQQALQEMLDMTQREITVVNRKLIQYATSITDDNLENIIDDLEMEVDLSTKDVLRREYDRIK